VSGQFHIMVTLPLKKTGSHITWIGGWMGHRSSLDVMEKRKITALSADQSPVIQPEVSHWDILAHIYELYAIENQFQVNQLHWIIASPAWHNSGVLPHVMYYVTHASHHLRPQRSVIWYVDISLIKHSSLSYIWA